MRRLITISCLAIFVALFLVASVDYFKHVAYPAQPEIDYLIKIFVLACLAGVPLAQFLYAFSIIQIERPALRAALGMLVGVAVFGAVFMAENVMSTVRLSKAIRDNEVFAGIQGHCGVYSGRGLVRWYQLSFDPNIENRLQAFQFSNRCRIDHFLDLRKRNQLPCQADEDSLGCLSRWMLTFSKRGYWNYPTRKMFFEEAKTGLVTGPDAEAGKKWVGYALRDYELEQSHPTMIQQAGIEEGFNDVHHYHKVKEELDNLLLTKEVFEYAAQIQKDDKSPDTIKFREVRKEVELKLEKVPELEELLQTAKSKISYSP